MAEDRDPATKQPATQRADELLNRLGSTAGLVGSMVGTRLVRIAAFAREEAEDMWAEAKHLRQQEAQASEVKEQKPEPAEPETETTTQRTTENTESIQATETARQQALWRGFTGFAGTPRLAYWFANQLLTQNLAPL